MACLLDLGDFPAAYLLRLADAVMLRLPVPQRSRRPVSV